MKLSHLFQQRQGKLVFAYAMQLLQPAVFHRPIIIWQSSAIAKNKLLFQGKDPSCCSSIRYQQHTVYFSLRPLEMRLKIRVMSSSIYAQVRSANHRVPAGNDGVEHGSYFPANQISQGRADSMQFAPPVPNVHPWSPIPDDRLQSYSLV